MLVIIWSNESSATLWWEAHQVQHLKRLSGTVFWRWWHAECVCVCVCVCVCMSVDAQLCPTLYESMDCNLPGSSVHGIFQARILEWVAISFSRGSSWLRDLVSPALAGWFFTTAPPGNLTCMLYDLAIPLLHVYPREIKEHGRKKTSIRMFPAALFVIALNWKQLK